MMSGNSRWNSSGSSGGAEKKQRRAPRYWWLWGICSLPVLIFVVLLLQSSYFLTHIALPAAGWATGWRFEAEELHYLSGRIRMVNFVASRRDCYLTIPSGQTEVALRWRNGALYLELDHVDLNDPLIAFTSRATAALPSLSGDGSAWWRIDLRGFLIRDGMVLIRYGRDRMSRVGLRRLAAEYTASGDWMLRGRGGFSLQRSQGEELICDATEISTTIRIAEGTVPNLCRGKLTLGALTGRVGEKVLPPTTAALRWELVRERDAWRIRRFALAETRGERPGEIELSGKFRIDPLMVDLSWRVPYVSDTLAALFIGWFLPEQWHIGDASGSGRLRIGDQQVLSSGELRCVRIDSTPQVRHECTARYDVKLSGHNAPYSGSWHLRNLSGELRTYRDKQLETTTWSATGEGAWDEGRIALDSGSLRVDCNGKNMGRLQGRGEIDWFGGSWKLRGGLVAGPYWSDGEIKRLEGEFRWVSSGEAFGAKGQFDFQSAVSRLEFLCMQSTFSGQITGSGSWEQANVRLHEFTASVQDRVAPILKVTGDGYFPYGKQWRMNLRTKHLLLADARRIVNSLDADWLATPTRDWTFGQGMVLDCAIEEVEAECGVTFSGTGTLDWQGGRFLAKPVFVMDDSLLDCEILSRGRARDGIFLKSHGLGRNLDVATFVRMFWTKFVPGSFAATMREGRYAIACENLCSQNGKASWSGEALLNFEKMVLDSSINKTIVGRILLAPFFALGQVGSVLPKAFIGIKGLFTGAGDFASGVGVIKMDRGVVEVALEKKIVKLKRCRFEGGLFRTLTFGGEIDLTGEKPLNLNSDFDFGFITLPMRIDGPMAAPKVHILW